MARDARKEKKAPQGVSEKKSGKKGRKKGEAAIRIEGFDGGEERAAKKGLIPILVRPQRKPVDVERDDEERSNTYMTSYMHPEIAWVQPDELRSGVEKFLDNMKDAIPKAFAAVHGFKLDAISIAGEINGKGGVHLVGLAELGGRAGITFTFKRQDEKKKDEKKK